MQSTRYSCQISMKVELSKDSQISNLMENLPVGASCSMQTDGQTEMTKLIVAFRNFANALNKNLLPRAALWYRYYSDAAVPQCEESCSTLFRRRVLHTVRLPVHQIVQYG
jgi:hypothetical protein